MNVVESSNLALQKFDEEIEFKTKALQNRYLHLAETLLAQTELQLVKIPSNIRSSTMRDILSRLQVNKNDTATLRRINTDKTKQSIVKGVAGVKRGRIDKASTNNKKTVAKRTKKT